MTLLHFLVEIKEMAVGGATYGIVYNLVTQRNNNRARSRIIYNMSVP